MKWRKKPLSPKIIPQSPERNTLGDVASSFLLRQEVSVVFVFPPYLVPSRGRLVVQGKRLAEEAECFFEPATSSLVILDVGDVFRHQSLHDLALKLGPLMLVCFLVNEVV